MIEAFGAAFVSTVAAVAAIFLVIFVSGLMVRRDIISQQQISGLSVATVNIFLPCLIFSKVVATLKPAELPGWWALPLAGIAMALVGTGLGALVFAGKLREKRNMLPLAGMQNAGYLVLPIGLALFPDRFDTFALYVFLFILGYNPILWSLGKLLVSGNGGTQSGWRQLVTPPFVANLLAIAFALSGAAKMLPAPVFGAIELLGTAAVPVATLVLGAILGSIEVRLRSNIADTARALGVKLVLLPAVTVTLLHMTRLYISNPLLADFFVIEAASAPAVALVLQVRTYGGDERRVGSVMFFSYLACTLTLPAWVAIWRLLVSG
jgi:predicted permease